MATVHQETTGSRVVAARRRRRIASIPAWTLDEMPFAIALLRASDLVFVYANHLYESCFAIEPRSLEGKRLEEAHLLAPQVVDIFKTVAETGQAVRFGEEDFVGLQQRPVELPGHVTRWDWSVRPVTDRRGAVNYLVVSGYDITAPDLDRLHFDESHEGIRAVLEVSRLAGTSGTIEDFFGDLSATIAWVVRAERVVFARVVDGLLTVQRRSHGFDDDVLAGLSVSCSPRGDGWADRIVYRDEVFRAKIDSSPEFDPYRQVLAVLDLSDAVAVAWRAGNARLGIVAAFNSHRETSFTADDVRLLKAASMAAALVWSARVA